MGLFNIALYAKELRCSFKSFEQCTLKLIHDDNVFTFNIFGHKEMLAQSD